MQCMARYGTSKGPLSCYSKHVASELNNTSHAVLAGVLCSLLQTQRLDRLDIEGVMPVYCGVGQRGPGSHDETCSSKESLDVIRDYLASATVKDCSIMITMQPMQCVREGHDSLSGAMRCSTLPATRTMSDKTVDAACLPSETIGYITSTTNLLYAYKVRLFLSHCKYMMVCVNDTIYYRRAMLPGSSVHRMTAMNVWRPSRLLMLR